MESKLYVGNLSYSTTTEALQALFVQAGTVSSVDIIKDRMTGRSKGFAFVQMSSPSEAEAAIRMFNSYKLDNFELKVSIARPREEGDRPGGGAGGPRRPGGGGGGYGANRPPANRDRNRSNNDRGGGRGRF